MPARVPVYNRWPHFGAGACIAASSLPAIGQDPLYASRRRYVVLRGLPGRPSLAAHGAAAAVR
jgi:hypothetical protein